MIALYIILGILLCLLLVLLLRIRVILTCDEGIRVTLAVLFIRIRLYPRKKRVRVRDYSYRRYHRLRKKKKKKDAAKTAKNEAKQAKKKSKLKLPLKQRISLFVSLFDGIYQRFLRYFRIDIAKLKIDIATGDAAKTAILTGVVSQSVAYLCAILEKHTNLGRTYRAEIAVQPNYLAEHSRVEGRFIFSIRIIRLLDIGLRLSFRFLKLKLFPANKNTTNTKEKDHV